MIVLDASVILKWILDDEPDRHQALNYRDQHIAGINPVVVPELLFYEVANVLVTKTKLPLETAEEGFNLIVQSELESYSLGVDEHRRAMRLSKQFRISFYDSSYIALAESLGCAFITADAKLVKKIKKLPHIKLL